jgi:hypothetical protein
VWQRDSSDALSFCGRAISDAMRDGSAHAINAMAVYTMVGIVAVQLGE